MLFYVSIVCSRMTDRRSPGGDWTLYVYSRAPTENRDMGRDLTTTRIELEKVGIFQSKQRKNISFPYYQNKSKKIIVVKGTYRYILHIRITYYIYRYIYYSLRYR